MILPCSSLPTSNPSHSSHFSSKLYFNSILISKGIATIPAPFTLIFYFRTGLSPSNLAPNHSVSHTEACLLKHSTDVSSPFNLIFSTFPWNRAQDPTLCRGFLPCDVLCSLLHLSLSSSHTSSCPQAHLDFPCLKNFTHVRASALTAFHRVEVFKF